MPLDTQTFALSRWWAHAALAAVNSDNSIFSAPNLRVAKRQILAGKNQLIAIKNWLNTTKLIERDGQSFRLSRFGRCIFENDKEFRKSSSWWAFHLLACFGDDPFPYDALFKSLDPNVRQSITQTTLKNAIYRCANDTAPGSVDTYLEGVLKMFREDGPLQGLGLVEQIKGRNSTDLINSENYWKLGSPRVPDAAVLFALALARRKFFSARPSIDFSELIEKGVNNFLTLSQDNFRRKLSTISNDTRWSGEIKYDEVANISSISFGSSFKEDQALIVLLTEGGDSWN